MTIIDLITPIVAALNTNDVGEESNAPLFLYGPKSYQNIKDDVDITYGVVYLDEPILSNDTLKLSGYLEEKYSLGILFGFKGGIDLIPTDERILIDKARELRRRFINLLSLSKLVRYVDNIRTIDITKEYDLSLSGCFLTVDVTPLNQLSNCLPEAESGGTPDVTLSDFGTVTLGAEPFELSGGSPSGGEYFANGERVTGDFNPDDYGVSDVVIRYTYTDQFGSASAEQILSIVEAVPEITTCQNPNALNFGEEGECIFPEDALVTFETDALKAIQTQIGANLIESDIPKIPLLQSAAVALELQVLYWFTLHSDPNLMDTALATKVNNLAAAMGTDKIVYYPVAQISTPPFTKLDWLTSTLNPVAVALDAESQVDDATTYKARAAAAMAHLGGAIKKIIDDALVYRTNPTSLNWNTQLADLAGSEIGRQYIQLSDQIDFDEDMDSNLEKFNNYRTVTFFEDLANFLFRLPNQKKKGIMQWHTEDTGQSYVSDKPLGNYIIADTIRLILSNTESFEYLIWMTLGNLIKSGVPEPEYDSIKRLVPLFKFPYVFPVTIPFPGCDALGFWDGADDWAMLITNQSGDQQDILASDIAIPGKTISGSFTNDYGTALSWDDPQVNDSEVALSIYVHPYGVNVITFSTAAGSSLTPATHTVIPSDTDPLITLEADYPNYAYVPGSPNGKLLIYLPGSGSHPSGCQLWMQAAQDEGYHVLGINYYNKLPSNDLCNTITTPEEATYLDLYSQEILFGSDLSPLTEVDVNNCIENRIKKLLTYLDLNYPAEGWDTFLVGGVIQWNLITVSGHSQGGDHAAFLGKYRALEKVIMFSSPRDICRFDTPTAWGSFLTPLSAYRAFSHSLDNYDKQLPTWTDMGIELPPVDVETSPLESSWGKTLITSRTAGIANFHKCTLTDAVTPLTGGVPDFLPVWIHLLNE